MESSQLGFQPVLQHDLDTAWSAIGVVLVDDKEHAKNWEDWKHYANGANASPYFHGMEKPSHQNLLLAFATQV
jgi:hypothetical protein